MPAVTLLPLAKFTIDRSLFARSGKERSPDTVSHYATRMQAGDAFPPVVAFNDGQRIYLVDGELRYLAAKRLGLNALETEIRPGSRREARLFGAQANARNGESRSVADRRLAVLMVLEECPDWSVPKTADHCRVSTSLVTGLVEVRARMPSVKAEEASAKSARETLGKPAPQRPTVPVPSVIPSPRAPSLAPKASMPTPRYVPPPYRRCGPRRRSPCRRGRSSSLPRGTLATWWGEEEAHEDEDAGLDRETLEERMYRAGRKFLRFAELLGVTPKEACDSILADRVERAARGKRRAPRGELAGNIYGGGI